MAQKRKSKCRKCEDVPYRGGLCKKHLAEDQFRQKERGDSDELLWKRTVDKTVIGDPALHDEVEELVKCWDRICRVANSRILPNTFGELEIDTATSLCQSWAAEIVDIVRASRAGKPSPHPYRLKRENARRQLLSCVSDDPDS